ncbi:MAG: hypothetical protein ACR2P5_09165 [Gammaproteobacteria bacterium]
MREVAALVISYLAVRIMTFGGSLGGYSGSFLTILGFAATFGGIAYFAAAIAERFYTGIGGWYRITPGTPTEMDELEWERIGKRGADPTLPVIPPGGKTAMRQNPQATQTAAAPPAHLYDSGFDNTAAAKPPAKAAPDKDNFNEIF